jgi:AraC-like DNA-binding protein
VVDTARPFRVAFPRPVCRVIAIVPRAHPAFRGRTDGRPVSRLTGSGVYLDLVRAYLSGARQEDTPLAAPESLRLLDHLAELVALAGAAQSRFPAKRTISRAALFDYMALHFADPGLSPRHAAAALGVSVRLVHRHCADAGTSFGRWMLERRLQACRADLEASAARTISDIAFARGFNDLAHFSRAFKARFGLAPRHYRSRFGGA